uniref:Protein kinase domain-containing protein n=1 Tax=Strongyloides stercoralis TaxID=6248 RepID=A0A0K0DXR5_STRER
MEYTPWDLRDIMEDYDNLNQILFGQKLFKELVNGLNFIHISDKLVAKIGDFGQTVIEGNTNNLPNIGTRWYKAIELLLGSTNFTKHVDLWSLGCIIFEWYRRYPIFNGLTDLEQIYQIIKVLGIPDLNDYADWAKLPDVKKISFSNIKKIYNLDSEFINIPLNVTKVVQVLLKINPLKRLSTTELLSMDYFSSNNFPEVKFNITKQYLQKRRSKKKKKERWKKIILEYKIDI